MDLLIPFDTVFPLGSTLYLLIICFSVAISVSLSDTLIRHRIEIKKILILSLCAYSIPLILFSTLVGIIPYGLEIAYISPLVVWTISSTVIGFQDDFKKNIAMAFIGYAVFIFLAIIKLQLLIAASLPF